MDKPLKVRLHIVSPVHIGCDDVYEPTSFVIDEKKGRLIEFDPMDFIRMLSQKDREGLSKTCMGDDLLGIFKFIKNKYNLNGGKEVEISKSLVNHYKKVLELNKFNKNDVINQFTISKTAYNSHNGLPYFPGSSIKGAMRTAFLTKLSNEQNIESCWKKYLEQRDLRSEQEIYYSIGKKNVARKLEAELLGGSFEADPFSMVKVSDFIPANDVKTKIVYALNKKKKRSDRATRAESGPPQILEVIQDGSVFEGLINIQQPLPQSNIKRPIGDSNFLNVINDFFQGLFVVENIAGTEIGIDHVDTNKFNEQFGKTAFLIRIGRHSGAEAVTIEGNRNIKIMQGKDQSPKFLDHATTIWLASDTNRPVHNSVLIPFGWAVLELLTFDINNLYPVSTIKDISVLPERDETLPKPEIKHAAPIDALKTILWGNATLTWSPGNMTLMASKDKQKAEIILRGSRDIVPEPLRNKLIEKKKSATANVTVEAIGNLFKIIKIEVS